MWSKIKALLGFGEAPEVVAARKRMQEDHQDPRKAFVFGVLSMSYEVDPGYLEEHGRMAIGEWYGLGSREEVIDAVQRYLAGTGSTPAYDAFRAAFLARAGMAAGMLSEEESWHWALQAARRVQQSYGDWQQYGMGYLEGHLAYRQSEGDDAAALEQYRRNITKRIEKLSRGNWATVPIGTPL